MLVPETDEALLQSPLERLQNEVLARKYRLVLRDDKRHSEWIEATRRQSGCGRGGCAR